MSAEIPKIYPLINLLCLLFIQMRFAIEHHNIQLCSRGVRQFGNTRNRKTRPASSSWRRSWPSTSTTSRRWRAPRSGGFGNSFKTLRMCPITSGRLACALRSGRTSLSLRTMAIPSEYPTWRVLSRSILRSLRRTRPILRLLASMGQGSLPLTFSRGKCALRDC